MKGGYGMFMAMAAAMGAFSGNNHMRTDELDGIDIEFEYELIKQKKSRLSRRLRDMVCYRYENRKS
jgi:hypothetical protein